MAERRERTANTVLADSIGARKRFGFGVGGQQPIETAPKTADMWFVELRSPGSTSSDLLDVSAQAKAVSNISIQTTTQPVDRYGKRIYVPTRVDFPEVTLTMYDTVNGEIIALAAKVYEQFFKNNSLSTSADSIESTISEINSGRKFHEKGQSFHRNFEKVTIHHFFGNFANGQGKIQKIELINPVVTNISFSPNDYSDGGLKTIDFSLQPENIIFGKQIDSTINEPDWMKEGLEMILTELDPENSNRNQTKSTIDLAAGPSKIGSKRVFGSGRAQTNAIDNLNKQSGGISGNFEPTGPDFNYENDPIKGAGGVGLRNPLKNFDFRTEAVETGGDFEQRINDFLESHGYDSSSTGYQGQREMAIKKAEAAQLKELSKLYANLKAAEKSRDNDAAQEAMNSLIEARKNAMPITTSDKNRQELNIGQTQAISGNVTNRQDTSNNTYTNDTLYPNIAAFSSTQSMPVGLDRFSSGDLADVITKELVNSFFNGRKVNINNITRAATQGILGNTLIGDLASLPKTTQSRFGVAGDIIRDSIINSSRTASTSTNSSRTTLVNTRKSDRSTNQSNISNVNNQIKRLR